MVVGVFPHPLIQVVNHSASQVSVTVEGFFPLPSVRYHKKEINNDSRFPLRVKYSFVHGKAQQGHGDTTFIGA